MPNSVDKKHSPSEFYYPGETNYPKATFQGEDNAEENSNKNSQEKVFSGLFYKVRKNCDSTKHIINPLLTSFARSVRESIAFGFYRTPQAILSRIQTSHSVNKY